MAQITFVFAQMVSSQNKFSGMRGFVSSSKQGGVSEITKQNSNTGNIQKRRAK
jgi:hypothetical protein